MMKRYKTTVNGVAYDVVLEEVGIDAPAAAAPAPSAPAAGTAGSVSVNAPMPGNVLDVKTSVGAAVKAGDILVILEAMKMENEIVAPQDGTIASINVQKGAVVNVGDVFLTMN